MLLLVASHVDEVSAAACQAWQSGVAKHQTSTFVPSNSSIIIPARLNATVCIGCHAGTLERMAMAQL
jgi:hypothetical protein